MSEKINTTTVLGLMSGTSLDGLDLALCTFSGQGNGEVTFSIDRAMTLDYTAEWRALLGGIARAGAVDYFKLHAEYGRYVAEQALVFIKDSALQPAAIASHGHTIFHQPALGFSTQLGCGATIAALTGITTVCDFRSLDVALGGQGAPLVPVGDRLLFGAYSACLNIGGIANISFDDQKGQRLAYDVCEANMLLNHLAMKSGKAYDKGGEMARSGKADPKLLLRLNAFDFYKTKGARSLGREWFEEELLGVIETSGLAYNDLLATATEHVAQIIAGELNQQQLKNVLLTGGGAWNDFLVERIRSQTRCEVILPAPELVNFKEALIFAFLGHLRLQGQTNSLRSVTGAGRDSVGGSVYLGDVK